MTSNVTNDCQTLMNCEYFVKENEDLQMYNISEHTVLTSSPYTSSTVASHSGSSHITSAVDRAIHHSLLVGPEWTIAKQLLGCAWEIHIYVLGGLFVMVELFNINNVVRFWRRQRLLPTGYFICLNAMLACICFSRSIYLLHCGYDSEQTCQINLSYFLYTIPFPCLTSGFSILFSWILRAADLQVVSFFLLRLKVLIPIIVTHYILSIITNILIGHSPSAQVLHIVSQAVFIVWSLYLFFGYTYIFRKLYSHVVLGHIQIGGISYGTLVNRTDRAQGTLAFGVAVKITFVTAACGLALSGLIAYAMVDVCRVFTRTYAKPWPWWLYHSVLRLLELFMCAITSYTISLPLRYSQSTRQVLPSVLCGLDSCCCDYKTRGDNKRDRWIIFKKFFSANTVHGNNSIAAEGLSARYRNDGYSDTVHIVKTQPQLCDKLDSLIIVDDVYIRFETDHDINRIVDSFNESSTRPETFNETIRLTHPSDVANTGDIVENSAKEEDYVKESQINVDGSSLSNIAAREMFRAPSSVSIADSMEKEFIRVFESFKVDKEGLEDTWR